MTLTNKKIRKLLFYLLFFIINYQYAFGNEEILNLLSPDEKSYYQSLNDRDKDIFLKLKGYAILDSEEKKKYNQLTAEEQDFFYNLSLLEQKKYLKMNKEEKENFYYDKLTEGEKQIYLQAKIYNNLNVADKEKYKKLSSGERIFFTTLSAEKQKKYLGLDKKNKIIYCNSLDEFERKVCFKAKIYSSLFQKRKIEVLFYKSDQLLKKYILKIEQITVDEIVFQENKNYNKASEYLLNGDYFIVFKIQDEYIGGVNELLKEDNSISDLFKIVYDYL